MKNEEKTKMLNFVEEMLDQINKEMTAIETVPAEHRSLEERGQYTGLQREQKFLELLIVKPKAYILATLQRVADFALCRQDTKDLNNVELIAEIRLSQRYGDQYKAFTVAFRATQERRTSSGVLII